MLNDQNRRDGPGSDIEVPERRRPNSALAPTLNPIGIPDYTVQIYRLPFRSSAGLEGRATGAWRTMPSKIFINYRRDDDPNGAARVRDGLATKFGKSNIFMDVDNLLAGQRFDQELARALLQCDVLVAIMGTRWMERLRARVTSDERDYVRLEIAEALRRNIIVIPVRVGREGELLALPREKELPEDIRQLVSYQKHDVVHEKFGRDIAALTDAILMVRRGRHVPKSSGWTAVGLAAVALLALGVAASQLGWVRFRSPAPSGLSAAAKSAADAIATTKADDDFQAQRRAEAQRKAEIEAEVNKRLQEAEAKRRTDEARRQAEEAERQRVAAVINRKAEDDARAKSATTATTSAETENKTQALNELGLWVKEEKSMFEDLFNEFFKAKNVTSQGSHLLVIRRVERESDAAQKEIKAGDIILEINGVSVSSVADIKTQVAEAISKSRRAVLLRIKSGENSRFVAVALK